MSSAAHYSHDFQQFRLSASVVPPVSDNMEAFNLPFTISSSSLTSPGEDSIRYEMISHLSVSAKCFLLDTLNGLWISRTTPDVAYISCGS